MSSDTSTPPQARAHVTPQPVEEASPDPVTAFVSRWKPSGGGERSNYVSFLNELSDLLGVNRPDPATPDNSRNAYVFERAVEMAQRGTTGYIDLYKRGCFVCETKQGVEREESAALSEKLRERRRAQRKGHGVRGTRAYDEVMRKARSQAESYARNLLAEEGRPPFLLIIDVGHSIELWSEFTCSGGEYVQFPDAHRYRIQLDDLADPAKRDVLRRVWEDPLSLDPTRRSAKGTEEVATKLADLARSFEADGEPPRIVTEFLMRCLFTMFAEDIGLLPKNSFTNLLKSMRGNLRAAPKFLADLWGAMDSGRFYSASGFGIDLKYFNGGLFRQATSLPLNEDQLELLIEAAASDWSEVEPSIFGTLLERALDPHERHKLGAHYTPRSYVERLILPTVISPLRRDWAAIDAHVRELMGNSLEWQAKAAELDAAGKHKNAAAFEGRATRAENEARKEVEDFHKRLCTLRVLDPACGSGNFLYVTLEHLKRLEAEVLSVLETIAGTEVMRLELNEATARPRQMLGLEINERAKPIAELVLSIGYIQWQIRNTGDPDRVTEPVIEDVQNISCTDAILAYDRVEIVNDDNGRPLTRWDGRTTRPHPVTGREVPDESATIPLYRYINPRPAEWPEADYIVGNPPFIGASRMRDALGDGYVEVLRKTIKAVPESADYVMYWWNRAADLVRTGKVQRFGFVTTNSLRQTFNRRVISRHLTEKKPLSLSFAIPDHPWVDDSMAAAVRVAMTVGEAGDGSGVLKEVCEEESGDGEGYFVTFDDAVGKVQADLTVGAAVNEAAPLAGNSGISNRGVQLIGSGFIVTPEEAQNLGLGRLDGLEQHIREYRNGKDLTATPRGVMVIDLFGLSSEEVEREFPEVYQWVAERVKSDRDQNNRAGYRNNWWIHGEPRRDLRRALAGKRRYIATVETSKHRFFAFLDESVLPDNMLVNIATDDAFHLGVLSSRIHVSWALATGGTLEDRPRYNKTRCFETFPFPDASEAQKTRIRELGERLDAFRKERQRLYPELTMTGMYNVLEKLRAEDEKLTPKERKIHEEGCISVLKQIHEELDAAVFDAYGWNGIPAALKNAHTGQFFDFRTGAVSVTEFADASQFATAVKAYERTVEQEILTRLVDLNRQRVAEEAEGNIRWLRPEYQNPEFGGQETGDGRQDAVKAQGSDDGEQADLDLETHDLKSGQTKPSPASRPPSAMSSPKGSPSAKLPWPSAGPAQYKAVRDALLTLPSAVEPSTLAALFNKAPTDRLQDILETLNALGQAHEVDGRYSA